MASPTIKIDQSGKSAGVAGQSRSDLDLGVPVSLTDPANVGDFTWELITPPGSSAGLSGAYTPNAIFTPDVRGTYLAYVTSGVDKSWTTDAIGQRVTTQGGCAILEANGVRPIGIGETFQFHSTRGWANDFHPNFALIDAVKGMQILSHASSGVARSSYGSQTPLVVGSFLFNPSSYMFGGVLPELYFRVVAANGSVGLTNYVKLVNTTDSLDVATLSFTSTVATSASPALTIGSGVGKIPDGDRLYEVQIYLGADPAGDENKTIELYSAHIAVEVGL